MNAGFRRDYGRRPITKHAKTAKITREHRVTSFVLIVSFAVIVVIP